MAFKRSRVHLNYKMKYAVANWRDYESSLVARGDVTLWISPAVANRWRARSSKRRGAQPKFTDLAIEACLSIRLVFGLPLRQTEGFVGSITCLADLDLTVPDHTTLSRRAAKLQVAIEPPRARGPIHLILDSTGLTIHGEGEWAAARRGRRAVTGYKKLHLAVDGDGTILGHELTGSGFDDAASGAHLMKRLPCRIHRVVADPAYRTSEMRELARKQRARSVIPPARTERAEPRSRSPRDRAIRRIEEVGRSQWKREEGYHEQARVENSVFRYKQTFGSRMRARVQDPERVRLPRAFGEHPDHRLICLGLRGKASWCLTHQRPLQPVSPWPRSGRTPPSIGGNKAIELSSTVVPLLRGPNHHPVWLNPDAASQRRVALGARNITPHLIAAATRPSEPTVPTRPTTPTKPTPHSPDPSRPDARPPVTKPTEPTLPTQPTIPTKPKRSFHTRTTGPATGRS